MADIRPFSAIRYVAKMGFPFSDVIAPPYDVLNAADKAALQAKHPNNIVNVDLPFMPPKSIGPDEVYDGANITLQAWLDAKILQRDRRPALYPYTQSYDLHGKTYHRRGFMCLVRLSPFDGGHVVPHELTHAGPIEDRLKLMRATGMQLSPIFGLFSDVRGAVTRMLYANVGRPELDGTLDGIRNQLWSVIDAEVERQVIDAIGIKPIYIADGHHRYTTALQYLQEMEAANGGPLPPNHPANFCLFVLVGMQEDGLQILPTHRLIGGITDFDPQILRAELGENFRVTDVAMGPSQMAEFAADVAGDEPHTFGLYDGVAKRLYTLHLRNNVDVLEPIEPTKSQAWRRLDVAVLHRYLLDEVIKPAFVSGKDLTTGYTADPKEIPIAVDGQEFQLAVLLRPTPLHALEELGKTGEVMPQKSTYFFPKLATGMAMYSLR